MSHNASAVNLIGLQKSSFSTADTPPQTQTPAVKTICREKLLGTFTAIY